MLNEKKERELAYVVKVDEIRPIPGRDKVECAVINGWTVMVRKDQFKAGDLGIYFEIDSKVPDKEPFKFLEAKHFKIKTQKYALKDEAGNKIGQFWSQGLLMGAEDFGWKFESSGQFAGDVPIITTQDNSKPYFVEGDFLTKYLEVTYAVAEDNVRKAPSVDKYKKMAARHPQLFQNPIIKWVYKRNWGKKLLFIFFGKKKDGRSWPAWVVKTDEERVQNMPWILSNKDEWVATEKIDGTSTTFTMKRGKYPWSGNDFYICSRNVCFDTPKKMEKGAWYDTNVYQEMAVKYNLEKVLAEILNQYPEYEFVTIQGETYGKGIQKREYGLEGHDLMVFNVIFGGKDGSKRRLNPIEMTEFMKPFNIPCVPVVDEHFVLPDTVEELLNIATDKSAVDGGMREGLVFRSMDGSQSFKAVSNEFLAKYHD